MRQGGKRFLSFHGQRLNNLLHQLGIQEGARQLFRPLAGVRSRHLQPPQAGYNLEMAQVMALQALD